MRLAKPRRTAPPRVDSGSPASSTLRLVPAPSTLRHDLRSSTGDAVSFSLMVGLGETYLPAFVLALGLGDVAAGLVISVPLAAGSLLQLVSPAGVRLLRSHRRWVVLCAVLQACCFLPLSVGAALGRMSLVPVFLAATVYWGAGLGTGGAWNAWIETVVPRRLRAHYFSRRTRFAQIALMIGFVAGGVGLQFAATRGAALTAFSVLFLLASLGRMVSAGLLARVSEPVPMPPDQRHVSIREWLARAWHGTDGRLLTYLFAVQSAAQFAGPYFTPYMLGPLKLDYAAYVVIIAVQFMAKALALPLLGKVAHRRGAYWLLCVSGVGIVPLSALWLVSNNFYWLCFVQTLAGIAWGGYELAMFLLFFETIPREERTSVLTTFNLGNSLAAAAGSILGGTLLFCSGRSATTFLTIFALSSVARGLALIALARVPVIRVPSQKLITRTLGVSAGDSPFEQPILPSMPDRGDVRLDARHEPRP